MSGWWAAPAGVPWPVHLPWREEAFGGTRTRQSLVVRAEFETGPPRRRRVSAGKPDKVTLALLFTSSELDIFEEWLVDALGSGVRPFIAPSCANEPLAGKSCWLQGDNGEDFTAARIAPDHYRVALVLEVAR